MQLPKKRRINRHITDLNSPDEKVSSRAEGYLIRYYGRRALEPLLEACQHPNPVVRFRAVWALAYTRDSRAYETILRLTDDPDEGVRYDATLALGILGDERAIEPLTRMFLSNDARFPAGTAFLDIGPKAVPALIEISRQGGPEVRECVIHVLGYFAVEFRDQRSIDLIRAGVNDPDPMVREDAAFWLQKISQTEPNNTI